MRQSPEPIRGSDRTEDRSTSSKAEPTPEPDGKATGDARRFALLGLRTDADFALHFPSRYEDWTRLTRLADAHDGATIQCDLRIRSVQGPQRGRQLVRLEAEDESGHTVQLSFFKVFPAQLAQWRRGQWLRAQGELSCGLIGREMLHPAVRLLRAPGTAPASHFTPVYPSTAGLSQYLLRRAVQQALGRLQWPEPVSAAELSKALALPGLPTMAKALRSVHEPPAGSDLEAIAQRRDPHALRVAIDELLAQQLSLQRARKHRESLRAPAIQSSALAEEARARLSFQLTRAQDRVLKELRADLGRELPMHRLLQGDVGSGKTVVALLAALEAIGNRFQVALLAPTEILAEQHAAKWLPIVEALRVRCAWLTGSLKAQEKRRIRQALEAHQLDLILGTHAILEPSVRFANLGLAIIDEQHRFGVAQRLRLRDKRSDGSDPHLLMMSATPIPRTLAMSYFSDLDVSVIDELPPGRRPVRTRLLQAARRLELMQLVRSEVLAGRQVYWVCPLIEESETLDLRHAEECAAQLREVLGGVQVGLVHSRLPSEEKQAVMQAFSRGELRLLVATTVIEVGVDVPQASLMIIEHAERFGLAQLHQLRGRVGRGSVQSECVLLYGDALGASARARLKAIYQHQDGFEIARHDLRIRGPGEFLGLRQSGLSLLRFADLERESPYLEAIRELAAQVLARSSPEDPAVAALIACWQGSAEDRLRA